MMMTKRLNCWTTILVVVPTITTIAFAAPRKSSEKVTVYLADQATVDPCLKSTAKALAQKIFSRYGITLNWKSGIPGSRFDGSIGITLIHSSPSLNLATSHALAHAKLNEGVSIAVFWDRIRYKDRPDAVLAYVFVHEITHLLQGVPRHAEAGIMKANWNRTDLAAMALEGNTSGASLRFESEDLDLIRKGLANRRFRAEAASDSMLRKVGDDRQ